MSKDTCAFCSSPNTIVEINGKPACPNCIETSMSQPVTEQPKRPVRA